MINTTIRLCWFFASFTAGMLSIIPAHAIGDNIAVFRGGDVLVDDLNDTYRGEEATAFGFDDDTALFVDHNGDGIDSLCVYRPPSGLWFCDIENDGFTGEHAFAQFGGFSGDQATSGNFIGDARSKDEIAIYRAIGNFGYWFIDRENNGYNATDTVFQFGLRDDIARAGDLNGDGYDSVIAVRGHNWYVESGGDGYIDERPIYCPGPVGGIPVVGDIDSDGKDELGWFNPTNAFWTFCDNQDPGKLLQFGGLGDQPIMGSLGQGVRGLSCLHCSHENAVESSKSIANVLANANIVNPALSFLIDDHFVAGRFEDRMSHLKSLIDTISGAGRFPVVELYLLNGPGQRRWADNQNMQLSDGFGTDIDPEVFNRRLEAGDTDILGAISYYMETRAKPLCEYVFERNGTCFVSPMLEDNLSQGAFNMVVQHLKNINTDARIKFVSNPNKGNANSERGTPEGWIKEIHTRDTSDVVGSDEFVTTDDGKEFPGYCALAKLAQHISGKNSHFIAWNKNLQGIAVAGTLPNPDARTYAVLDGGDASEAMQLLRSKHPDFCVSE